MWSVIVELRHLEHFVALAEENSFTRAAARLHLVQSASRCPSGTWRRILVRVVRANNAPGWSCLRPARIAPGGAPRPAGGGSARDVVAAVRGVVRGRLRVGIMQSLALIDAAALFAAFHRDHPEVTIEPRPSGLGVRSHCDQVRRGELDLAFAWHPEDSAPGLRVVHLASERSYWVAAASSELPRRELTLRELAGERFVEVPAGWGTRAIPDRAFLAAVSTGDRGGGRRHLDLPGIRPCRVRVTFMPRSD